MKILITLAASQYTVSEAEEQLAHFENSGRARDASYETRVSKTLEQRVKDAKRRARGDVRNIKKRASDEEDKWKSSLVRLSNRLVEVNSQISAIAEAHRSGQKVSKLDLHNLVKEKKDLETRIENVTKILKKLARTI